MIGLGESNGHTETSTKTLRNEGCALLGSPEVMHHEDVGEVANDTVFFPEIIVCPEAATIPRMCSRVEPNDRHPEIGIRMLLTPVDLGKSESVEAGAVCKNSRLVWKLSDLRYYYP